MSSIDPKALAAELAEADASRRRVDVLPSASDAVSICRLPTPFKGSSYELRRAAGHTTVGRKVGFANRAM
jgi:2-keto-4-pentenoate hydratase